MAVRARDHEFPAEAGRCARHVAELLTRYEVNRVFDVGANKRANTAGDCGSSATEAGSFPGRTEEFVGMQSEVVLQMRN